MTGAIEFLQKAKAICENMDACGRCPLNEMCSVEMNMVDDEADLVRKVMEYQIKEEAYAGNIKED